jgi:hypothetical protein
LKAAPGPRPLAVPAIAAPADDDTDDSTLLKVVKAKSDGVSSVQAFLDSAFSLIQ